MFAAFIFIGIAAAIFSTANSQIHAVATVYTVDVHRQCFPSIPEGKLLNVAKWAVIGTVLAAFFIILSFVPGSPGFLSVPSMIILGVWVLLGIIFFIRIKDNFLHGKWEGVSVENILKSKMKESADLSASE